MTGVNLEWAEDRFHLACEIDDYVTKFYDAFYKEIADVLTEAEDMTSNCDWALPWLYEDFSLWFEKGKDAFEDGKLWAKLVRPEIIKDKKANPEIYCGDMP